MSSSVENLGEWKLKRGAFNSSLSELGETLSMESQHTIDFGFVR
ncbi:hypothetical protein LEP1GSC194_1317 [Leptospira alstonii serovar Sichuan str. 79601]|uniref:Uncharacterized protein n=1 Tax=Leptospira alstonii serovar Sichuan str. 79601 TaxID=1218565 RepID=M6CGP6_9LEPT|nr:hypothetical protein LEP1GSC194_1317 [Leptospira alstonii serovar Sichuan str. 79601]